MNLRDATEGVGVLHVLFLALDDFRTFQQRAEYAGGLYLALVGTHLLDLGEEGLDAAVEGFEAHCAEEVEAVHQVPAVDEGLDAVGAHELCAVEQGQTLFGFQLDGIPAEDVECLFAADFLAFIHHVAFADEREEKVGQRGEVARSAERAAVVDHRENIVVVEVEDTLHGLDLHAAESHGKGVGLEQEHKADNVGVDGGAHAARVALDEVFLECGEVVAGDVLVAERAETGGNAVDGNGVFVGLAVQVVSAMLYFLYCFGRERELRAVAQYAFYKVVGQF